MNIPKPLIIVFEDEYIIALDLKEILENEGYDVIIEVDSIEHGIELIQKLKPVLILLDINLKMDKDGIYIGDFLLDYDKVPYIFISSNYDRVTLDRVKATRPYGFIKKPFSDIDVITNVNIIINNYHHRKIDISRTIKKNEIIIDEVPFIIKKTIHYINENITGKIDIVELSKLTKWDKYHFSRLFSKYVGVTPYQYILNRKIEISKTMLIETNKQIIDIAFELGFDNHSNFSTRFKKFTGYSPDDFRKINKVKKWL